MSDPSPGDAAPTPPLNDPAQASPPVASAPTPPAGDTPTNAGDSKAAAALAAVQAAIAAAKSGLSPAPAAPATQSAASAPSAPAPSAPPAVAAVAFQPPVFDRAAHIAPPKGIDLLSDVNLNVKIELGRTRMLVEDVLKLNEGAVVELDKLAGDPVDVFVNDRHIARGEVLVLNDNFCVRINEIISTEDPNQRGKPRAA
jgi:flagellar motor switch protein FliN